MGFFDSSISSISTADLAELLASGAVENVMLEFKREVPGRDETLKKLSSFANTFGGAVLVGAEAGSTDGRLVGLPGVDQQANYRQTLVQWCTEGVSPPVQPFVSDAIPTPSNPDRYCYVIRVPESEETPHFLNGRKGAYIRTDEYSTRFEQRLATYAEIQHLANRRAEATARREFVLQRAERRWRDALSLKHLMTLSSVVAQQGATMGLSVVPKFPARPMCDHQKLLEAVESLHVKWRQASFPHDRDCVTQHESVVIRMPIDIQYSMLATDIWGAVRCSTVIQRDYSSEHLGCPGVNVSAFVGWILVILEYARVFYNAFGYDGTLDIRFELEHIRRVPLLHTPNGYFETAAHSPLDDEMSMDLTLSAHRLQQDRDGLAREVLQVALYAFGWSSPAREASQIDMLLAWGKRYNGWG